MVPGKSSGTTQGDLTAWMPELFFLRAVKIQAAACWPGEVGGVWAAERFGCRRKAPVALLYVHRRRHSRISAFIPVSKSMGRSARMLPWAQLASVGEASSISRAPSRSSELPGA